MIGVATLKEGSGFRDLNNPAHDAHAVSEALCDLGFDAIDLGADVVNGAVTRQDIKVALYDLAITLKARGGIGLVYFAGHGVQRGTETYLLPYDALVRFERDVSEELVPLSFVYDVLRYSGNPINVVVVDACRDDAWKRDLPVLGRPRPVDDAVPPLPNNVLLETSTLSGMPASDGSTDMSPFAKAFVDGLRLVQSDGMDLGPLLKAVNKSVAIDPKAGENPSFLDTARNIVLVPTRSTFLRERAVFVNATAANSFPAMKSLAFEYNAGYFYEAARKWMDDPPPPPVKPATATATTPPVVVEPPLPPLRPEMPGTRSSSDGSDPIHHAGIPIEVGGGTSIARLELPDLMAMIKVKPQAVLATVPPSAVLATEEVIPIIFESSRTDGLDKIVESSRAAFKAKFAADRVSDVEVVLERVSSKDNGDQLRGLQRQTEVLRMLHDVGVDTAATPLRTVATGIPDRDMSVTVTFRQAGASLVTGLAPMGVIKSVGTVRNPLDVLPRAFR